MNLFKKKQINEFEPPFETSAKPMANNNKVIAVWGNTSSGKTTVSCRLARYLAGKKKNVVLILADMTAPPMPYICPPDELESCCSMGKILGSPSVDVRLVQENCTLHRKNSYLTIIGLCKGENVFSYPMYSELQARQLIESASSFADYVVIDCTSNIPGDTLSAMALMTADVTLRLVTCDLKAISFLSSQLPLLGDSQWKADKHLKVISNVKPGQAKENIIQVLKGADFTIPHCKEVEQQFLEGNLFGELRGCDSREFSKSIQSIAEGVFGI